MSELNGHEMNTEIGTEAWTNEVDRGGLTHINDARYTFFEIELRKFYNIKKSITEQTLKSEIVKQISDSDDVLYYWDTLTEDQTQVIIIDELYDTIINEYVTVRGFYFASSIVESYKVLKKQNIQKSKGLRKTIPI